MLCLPPPFFLRVVCLLLLWVVFLSASSARGAAFSSIFSLEWVLLPPVLLGCAAFPQPKTHHLLPKKRQERQIHETKQIKTKITAGTMSTKKHNTTNHEKIKKQKSRNDKQTERQEQEKDKIMNKKSLEPRHTPHTNNHVDKHKQFRKDNETHPQHPTKHKQYIYTVQHLNSKQDISVLFDTERGCFWFWVLCLFLS